MNSAMTMIVGVGPDKVPVMATFWSDGGFSIELEKEVKLCKLKDVLEEYGIDIKSWPPFLQKVAEVDVWLWQLDARAQELASAAAPDKATKISECGFKPTNGNTWSLPADLAQATVVKNSDGSYELQGNKAYELKLDGATIKLCQKLYTLVISGNYAEPLELIKGMIYFQSFTVGISNGGKSEADLAVACKKYGNQLRERFLEQKKLTDGLKEMLPAAG